MQPFTCPTCGKEWPENYCPQCAATINRALVPKASSTTTEERETPTPVLLPRTPLTAGQVFGRALIWTCAVQLGIFVLYWLLGTDRATHSFNAFAKAYAWVYYPGVAAVWVLASPFIKDGLGLAYFGLFFGPLIGIAAYSLVLAFGAMIWFSIRRWNALAAA
jgi:hypothetical protein